LQSTIIEKYNVGGWSIEKIIIRKMKKKWNEKLIRENGCG
jgi:hypothetical protein